MTCSINFTDENAMEEKGQVSCQGYKAKLVIAAGVTVKKKKTNLQSRADDGSVVLAEVSRSEPSNSSAKRKSGCK